MKHKEEIDYDINNCNIYLEQNIIEDKKCSLTCNIKDIKTCHMNKEINNVFSNLISKFIKVKIQTRGKKHYYLDIISDNTEKQKLKEDIEQYIDKIIEEFSEEPKIKGMALQNNRLFKITKKISNIEKYNYKLFQLLVTKG